MRPLLLVMNPRRIKRCLSAIEALDIEKAWLIGFYEKQLEPQIAAIVDEALLFRPTGYTHLILLADDTVPNQQALNLVLKGLADGHPVVTGYCNLDKTAPHVNITYKPFRTSDLPTAEQYAWYTKVEAAFYAEPLIPTWFAGSALTGMSLDMWAQFPFRCVTREDEPRGYCSDWLLSMRLVQAGIPIVAPRGALIEHVKDNWRSQAVTSPEKELLVGKIKAEVVFSRDAPGLRV